MRHIAFIRPVENIGPIKVVETDNPRGTRARLEEGSPIELFLIGAVDAYDYPLSWWKIELEGYHRRDGWYSPSAQVLGLIEEVIAERVDAPGRDYDVPDRVPAHIARDDPAALKWAFPKGVPYPPIDQVDIEPVRAARLARLVLTQLKTQHSPTSLLTFPPNPELTRPRGRTRSTP